MPAPRHGDGQVGDVLPDCGGVRHERLTEDQEGMPTVHGASELYRLRRLLARMRSGPHFQTQVDQLQWPATTRMSLPAHNSMAHEPAARSPQPGMALPVSVVILTCNEESNIADCIASCRWCDDLHVLDSGSTDATRDIAHRMGAQVHIHPFESFGQQRNWAIDQISTRHPWIFHLDADERFTDELLREMAAELGADGNRSDVGAYLVPNKMMFAGKWLRFSGGYPAYQVRLFRIGKCRFIDFGHGQRELTSEPVRKLRSPYLHYNFSHGVAGWLLKHNRYSDRESIEAEEVLASAVWPWGVVTRDGTRRRRALKNLSFRLRGRAVWRFLYMFVLRFGFLDGPAGFHYCAMTSMYEYWTELKLIEHRSDWSRQNVDVAEKLLRK